MPSSGPDRRCRTGEGPVWAPVGSERDEARVAIVAASVHAQRQHDAPSVATNAEPVWSCAPAPRSSMARRAVERRRPGDAQSTAADAGGGA